MASCAQLAYLHIPKVRVLTGTSVYYTPIVSCPLIQSVSFFHAAMIARIHHIDRILYPELYPTKLLHCALEVYVIVMETFPAMLRPVRVAPTQIAKTLPPPTIVLLQPNILDLYEHGPHQREAMSIGSLHDSTVAKGKLEIACIRPNTYRLLHSRRTHLATSIRIAC